MIDFSSGRPVSALAVSPSGSHLAASTGEQTLSILPLLRPTSAESHVNLTSDPSVSTPSLGISSICYPGPSTVYTATSAGTFARYAVSGGPEASPPTMEYEAKDAHGRGTELTGVAAVSAESVVVTCGKDALVRCWDAETRQSVARLAGHKYEVRAVSVAESEAAAAGELVSVVASAGRDKTVRLWDVRASDSGAIHVFSGHTGWVHDVAISGGGGRCVAVSCAGDKTVRVWDLKMMREARVFTGHEYRVWGVAVAKDGAFAVSGSTDSTVRAWCLELGVEEEEACTVFNGHRDSVISVAMSRDGLCAVSGSEDGSVIAWDTAALFGRSKESSGADSATAMAEGVVLEDGGEAEAVPPTQPVTTSLAPVADEGDLLGLGLDADSSSLPQGDGQKRDDHPLAAKGIADDVADLFGGLLSGTQSPLADSRRDPTSPTSPRFQAVSVRSEMLPAALSPPASASRPAAESPLAALSPLPVSPPVAVDDCQPSAAAKASSWGDAAPALSASDLITKAATPSGPSLLAEAGTTSAKPTLGDSASSTAHCSAGEGAQNGIAAINQRIRMLSSRIDALLAVDVS